MNKFSEKHNIITIFLVVYSKSSIYLRCKSYNNEISVLYINLLGNGLYFILLRNTIHHKAFSL